MISHTVGRSRTDALLNVIDAHSVSRDGRPLGRSHTPHVKLERTQHHLLSVSGTRLMKLLDDMMSMLLLYIVIDHLMMPCRKNVVILYTACSIYISSSDKAIPPYLCVWCG